MITIGNTYHTRIGKNIIAVRLDEQLLPNGWRGTSVKTGKTMTVKTLCDADGTPLANGAPESAPADDTPIARNVQEAIARDQEPIDLEEKPTPAPEPIQPDLRPSDDGDAVITEDRVPPTESALGERVLVRDLNLGDQIKVKDFDQLAEILACHSGPDGYDVKLQFENDETNTAIVRLQPDEEVLRMATKNSKKAAAPKGAGKIKAAPAKVSAKPAPKADKKLSALDAAATVLAKVKEPMNCKDLIKAMTDQGLWTSARGRTPGSTLYSAILREINSKGAESRFEKVDRGQFRAKA